MKPYLWIAYDYTSTSQCLSMLDIILEEHQESNLIHEIGRPTLLQAALGDDRLRISTTIKQSSKISRGL